MTRCFNQWCFGQTLEDYCDDCLGDGVDPEIHRKMSTHWELECMDCGVRTEWGQSVATNHIDETLVQLCESGALQAIIAAGLAFDRPDTLEWGVSVHQYLYPDSLNIPIPGDFKGCAGHRIWPRNEYGDWAEGAPGDVVESPPMANDRDPRDPSKPVPYCLAANHRHIPGAKRRTPIPEKLGRSLDERAAAIETSVSTSAEYVCELETRAHKMRSAIADVTGMSMVGKTDAELCDGMLNYVQGLRIGTGIRLGHLSQEQMDASLLPQVLEEDGKTVGITVCDIMSGGLDEVAGMPRRLSLIRWRDGEEIRADYQNVTVE